MWQPILDGELADRARDAMRDIALAAAAEPTRGIVEDLALYWAYTASAFPDLDAHYEAATDRLADRLQQGYHTDALYGGAAGVGFVTAHVSEDAEAVLAVIDRDIAAVLAVPEWRRDYDLITGLVGLGVYFVERGDAGRPHLDTIVAHLSRLAVERPEGITWFTPPELLPPHQRKESPAGYYNCGLAHGVPGVIALLARAGDSPEIVRLRDGAVRWLAAQRTEGNIPATVDERGSSPSRTAWCYGDPGAALGEWRATRSTTALDLAHAALARPFEATRVLDPDLCHGAAGLAHIANRFFHATGDTRFRDLARTWYERTLAFRTPGVGIAGFRSHLGGLATPDNMWTSRMCILEGVLGVGLALQAAVTDGEPNWDRTLLCDLPLRD